MRRTDFYKFLFLFLAVAAAIAFSACSSKEVTKTAAEGEKIFSFSDPADGGNYQVTFDKKNNITSLLKNGKEIPASEYQNYKDVVFRNLNELSAGDETKHVYRFDHDRKIPEHFGYFPDPEDSESDDPEMDREVIIRTGDDSTDGEDTFRFRMPKIHKKMYVEKWDDSTFKHDMESMKEDLAKLKDVKIKVNFDGEKFRKEMEIFHRDLEKTLNEDLKNLNEEILEITKELKENRFDEIKELEVNIPDIDVELKNLDRKMENLDKEMSKVKTDIKKLDSFMNDLRSELYKDKIIESRDEDFSLNFSSESMKVNDREIPSNLLPKYKALYKKNFGKEISKQEHFEIQD